MVQISNSRLALRVSPDGLEIAIEDRIRGAVWRIDRELWGTIACKQAGATERPDASPFTPLGSGRVGKVSGEIVETIYPVPGGEAAFEWALRGDYLEVTLRVRSDAVHRIAHPGAFIPATGALEMLVPVGQGALIRQSGTDFFNRWRVGEATSLSMFACLGDRGALVVIEEDIQNKAFFYGRRSGKPFCTFDLWRCDVDGWYERRARVYVEDRSITAVCKRHRRRLIERGLFLPWAEKIQRKPILEKVFGALIAFIGYNQGRQTDYVRSARVLRESGFDTVFYYPVRMNTVEGGFLLGGDKPIRLSDDEIRAMQKLGGVLSPWSWIFETQDDGSNERRRRFRVNTRGEFIPHWKMDDYVFNRLCTPFQSEFMRQQYAGSLREMSWNHYDVNSLYGGECCFGLDHPSHTGQPLAAREDQRNVAELLGPELNGNRLVSSEGFNEAFAPYYDMGSCKYGPLCATPDVVMVPMSLLVFHDSVIHNWWELHTYNETPFGKVEYSQPGGIGTGPGQAEKKAAMDALYGCPPLIFAFGRQYGWLDFKTRKTFSFEIAVEEPEVQRAIRAALPVARLHRRIGRCEMTNFDLLSADGTVQATEFSDGTRVVANLSDEDQNTTHGCVRANSWQEFS